MNLKTLPNIVLMIGHAQTSISRITIAFMFVLIVNINPFPQSKEFLFQEWP